MRALTLAILLGIAIPACLKDEEPPDTCDGQRAPEGPDEIDPGCGSEPDGDADADADSDADADLDADSDADVDADADADVDADVDADGDADGDADRELCTPGGPARVMVTECGGDMKHDLVIGTGPRDDLGLLCDEMVECDEDADCTLIVIDRCCGREVASVPVELADDLQARLPECPEDQPECEPCPLLGTLTAECEEEGYCDVRFPPGA